MADKMRSINTKFWDDSFVQELNISEKLLFLYLLTNPLTNMLGIYEITLRRISFDTGLTNETIKKSLKKFGEFQKAFYIDEFIILPNFLKNQKLNTNMKIGVAKIFNDLPINIKKQILKNNKTFIPNDSEGFEMVRNNLLEYEKLNKEQNTTKQSSDVKKSSKKQMSLKSQIPDFSEFKEHALSKKPNVDIQALKNKYESWIENGWKDGNDKKITNWKSKLTNTLTYIPENKKTQTKLNLSELNHGLSTR
jgi:hypothetical protein